MSQTLTEKPVVPVSTTETATGERKGLTRKEIVADHPTWCPGCGDFSVLAL
jgi:2-oxoglutarate ferredoxin oxidoreductase subunit beta